MIKIYKFDYNSEDDLFSNTYVVEDENHQVVVIDPSIDNPNLLNFIKKNNFILKGILLTHAHYDHIQGVEILKNEYDVPIFIEKNEIKTIRDPRLNCSDFSYKNISLDYDFTIVKDKDILHLLNEDIEVIFTPFHTDGSVCYFFRNSKKLFSGDTLFKQSVGRDDLRTSVPYKRKESLDKLKALDDDVIVYPGHGGNTTIGEEKKLNVFFK